MKCRFVLFAALAFSFSNSFSYAAEHDTCPAPKISHFMKKGGRVDWKPDGTAIAFDRRGQDDCFDIFQVNADGSGEKCLTCGHPDLPPTTKGQPAYHPSGQFMAFQLEKAKHFGKRCGFFTNPGAGANNDLWIMNLKTGKAKPLYASKKGVLHPHFSPDGRTLIWSDLYGNANIFKPRFAAGRWAIKSADVHIQDGDLTLSNIKQLLPDGSIGEGMAETHGFTPDGNAIIFSGNLGYKEKVWLRNDIWIADITGKNPRPITSGAYNEHGHISPSGRTLAWMSSAWRTSEESPDMQKGTEFFVRNLSRPHSPTCRISHFNSPGYPEYQNKTTIAADLSWSPDGRSIAGYTHSFTFDFEENIWLISFDAAQ